MTRTRSRPLRGSIVPAVFIAWIWLGTLQILGFEPPLLIGVPVGLLLFGFLFWGLPPEMYWPPSTRSANPDGRVPTWWQSLCRHRFKSLSFVVMRCKHLVLILGDPVHVWHWFAKPRAWGQSCIAFVASASSRRTAADAHQSCRAGDKVAAPACREEQRDFSHGIPHATRLRWCPVRRSRS
jgi:hypothetical protein